MGFVLSSGTIADLTSPHLTNKSKTVLDVGLVLMKGYQETFGFVALHHFEVCDGAILVCLGAVNHPINQAVIILPDVCRREVCSALAELLLLYG
jgi:hypothetical protein